MTNILTVTGIYLSSYFVTRLRYSRGRLFLYLSEIIRLRFLKKSNSEDFKMEWNDGKERALFEREQERKREQYLAAGMTEEQIKLLRNFDEDWYRSRRREARHTQKLNITTFEGADCAETKSPLLKKFLHIFSMEEKPFGGERFGWIEQIEKKGFYLAVKSLSDRDKEIMTLLVFDGFNQTEIAEQLGVSQQAISKRLKKIQIIFEKWL